MNEDLLLFYKKIYQVLSDDYLYSHPLNLVIFADNHGMVRFYRQVHHHYKFFKMGLTFIMTMRGIPEFYYGDEILMSNKKKQAMTVKYAAIFLAAGPAIRSMLLRAKDFLKNKEKRSDSLKIW